MNDFDDIPFASESFEEMPFASSNTNSSFDDIPFQNVVPQVTNNNVMLVDERIKDVPARNAKVSFKRTSIIFPIVAFIFVSVLGMYLFVNNSKADTANLIKIEEDNKIGYIDEEGTIVSRAKYTYGTDFYKGYAIVKNNNNLYGVIDGKGVVEVPFGNYYYIGMFGGRYIASKLTNDGLKQALLDSKLDELTSFKYDSISYSKNGMFLFKRDETMGIINKEGKEIYSFKVDEVDDRNIDIEISKVNDDLPLSEKYAMVKVNESSTIINLDSGKEVYSYTLKDINVLDNNVFYIKADNIEENSTYLVIRDGQVRLKTNKFKRMRIDDYDSDIAIGINDDSSISYVNLLTQKIMNENKNNDYYYGNGLIIEKSHDFGINKDIYNIVSSKKTEGSFKDYTPVNNTFYNKMLNVQLYEGKYNYVDEKGNIINSNSYDETTDFNNFGYAIVANDKNYGIVNKKGKEVAKLSYAYIDYVDDDIFKILRDNYNKELFVFKNNTNNYGFINSKDKIEIDSIYDDIKYITNDYPIILVKYEGDDLLVNLSTGKELPIKITSDEISVKNNYIIIDGNYYNYSGKLIYSEK